MSQESVQKIERRPRVLIDARAQSMSQPLQCSDFSAIEATWRKHLCSITAWLDTTSASLSNTNIAEEAEKVKGLSKTMDHLLNLGRENLDQIKKHEAQWQQALNEPHTMNNSKVVGESAPWRKTFDDALVHLIFCADAIEQHLAGDPRAVVENIVRNGPELLKRLDEVKTLQQERLTEIEQCKINWNEAIATRKGELAEIDALVANRQPAVDAAKLATEAARNETKEQQSKLQRVQSEVQWESTQLSSLSHLRMNAETMLKETEEKAKKEKQSMNEARNSFNEQVEEHNRQKVEHHAQLNEMEQGLRAREQRLTEEEQQFKARCADTEQGHIQAEQKLEEDRTALQGETKKLQGDVSKARRRWNLLCDYRNLKDGEISQANEQINSLRALVDQRHEDNKRLRVLVDERDSKLQDQKKLLAGAKQSLDSMGKTKDDLATQLNYQKSRLQAFASVQSNLEASNKENEQLKADKERLSQKAAALEIQVKETQNGAATVQSLHGESMTSINTLNDNIAQMLAAHTSQMLASFQDNAVAETQLISRAKDLEEVIMPGLKEQLLLAEGELGKVKEDSNATIEGLRTESEDLRVKLLSKEKELSECNTMGVLIATSPEDKAALEKCRAEHSDVDALKQEFTELRLKNDELEAMCQEEKHAKETCDAHMQSAMIERDSAKEKIRKLNQKQTMFEAREFMITELQKQQQEAKSRDVEHERTIDTLERQLTNLKTQESSTINDLEVQVRELQGENDIAKLKITELQDIISTLSRDKRSLNEDLINITIQRDTALSAKTAALKAQKDACRERDEASEDRDQTSEANRTLAEDIRKLSAKNHKLTKELSLVNSKADRVTKELEDLQRVSSGLQMGLVNFASQDSAAAIDPEMHERRATGNEDEILDALTNMDVTNEAPLSTGHDSSSEFAPNQAGIFKSRMIRRDSVTGQDDQSSASMKGPQSSPKSRKRPVDDHAHEEHEQRKRSHTGRDVREADDQVLASRDEHGSVVQEQHSPQAGTVLNQIEADGTITFRLDDLRNGAFGCESVPADLLSKLRMKLRIWDTKKKWDSPKPANIRNCVETRIAKRPGASRAHGEQYACPKCEKAGDLCGLILNDGEITLLPVWRDAPALSPMDMAYWKT